MKNQKYEVRLTEEQRGKLIQFIKSASKKNTAQCKVHAKALLCLDQSAEKPLTPDTDSDFTLIQVPSLIRSALRRTGSVLVSSSIWNQYEQTAGKCKLHQENVYKIRKQFVTEGMERVLYRKKRETPPVPAKVTGEVEAHIIAIACGAVPKGQKRWTLRMIADKVVLEGVVDSLGKETVRRTLKKHNINPT